MWQVVQAAHKVPCHECLAQPGKPTQQQHMRQRVWQHQPSGEQQQRTTGLKVVSAMSGPISSWALGVMTPRLTVPATTVPTPV